jgi:hypothetical protein
MKDLTQFVRPSSRLTACLARRFQDRDRVGLAVACGFAREGVPHDGVIADDVGGLVGRAHGSISAISQGTPGPHRVDISGECSRLGRIDVSPQM